MNYNINIENIISLDSIFSSEQLEKIDKILNASKWEVVQHDHCKYRSINCAKDLAEINKLLMMSDVNKLILKIIKIKFGIDARFLRRFFHKYGAGDFISPHSDYDNSTFYRFVVFVNDFSSHAIKRGGLTVFSKASPKKPLYVAAPINNCGYIFLPTKSQKHYITKRNNGTSYSIVSDYVVEPSAK